MATTGVLVPAEQVVATAMSVLEGADTMDRAFFKEWVYLGLLEIGPNMTWFDESILNAIDYKLRKPPGFNSAIALALYDSTGANYDYVLRGYGTRIQAGDNQLINQAMYAPSQGAPIDLSEDEYYYHLGSNAGMISSARLKYWRTPFDANGDMLIPEQDIMALTQFIRYMWSMRKDDKQGINMNKASWILARNEARAYHKTPSIMEGTEIARSWNSMIRKQRYKQF